VCRHVDTGLRRKEKCAGMMMQDCEGRRSVQACLCVDTVENCKKEGGVCSVQ